MGRLPRGVVLGDDGVVRCFWGDGDPLYRRYHDREWGMPVRDGRRLFEKVCLEGFQAGLSWLIILRKREAFRRAFRGFDFHAVARFGPRDVDRLLEEPGIVRHRGKIESAINNAARAVELEREFGSLSAYFARFRPGPASRPRRLTLNALKRLPAPAEAVALSRDLKTRGWTFVGPTTLYAFMQAMGLVNDHLEGCPARIRVERRRRPRIPATMGSRRSGHAANAHRHSAGRGARGRPRLGGSRQGKR
jgi:DNA-3-methyladenine glycosylase I